MPAVLSQRATRHLQWAQEEYDRLCLTARATWELEEGAQGKGSDPSIDLSMSTIKDKNDHVFVIREHPETRYLRNDVRYDPLLKIAPKQRKLMDSHVDLFLKYYYTEDLDLEHPPSAENSDEDYKKPRNRKKNQKEKERETVNAMKKLHM
ncbi:uncharacterized protein L201_003077 [Kwoniella dendrophila CBS 6074]|uniref:Uncharacterized protein n=1 Tax=Kwoniella dendrophila CBS 6074 TaxID=1295534 RepID=A0AAX4JRZ0_9TREE